MTFLKNVAAFIRTTQILLTCVKSQQSFCTWCKKQLLKVCITTTLQLHDTVT